MKNGKGCKIEPKATAEELKKYDLARQVGSSNAMKAIRRAEEEENNNNKKKQMKKEEEVEEEEEEEQEQEGEGSESEEF